MDDLIHMSNARIMLAEGSERSFVNDTLAGLLAALEARDAKIGQLRQLIGDALERGGCGSSMWAEDATAALDGKEAK